MSTSNKIITQEFGANWSYYCGDCIETMASLPENSIHYSIFSPPFASLYTYSASNRDMGNCANTDEFFEHFAFAVKELCRVLMPGRLLSFHCMDLPSSKERDGFIGLKDFPARLLKAFQDEGFLYHSKVCIWKDPVTAMQRTKALGLLHKTIRKDSAMSRQGIADYLVTVRKPGVNPEPIEHDYESFPIAMWQQYASPVWVLKEEIPKENTWIDGFNEQTAAFYGCRPDIDPGDTLQSIREDEDERHICPLQLPVIERGIRLWTNPGDNVLSPFGGIASEGVGALRLDRKYIGIELKDAYFEQGVKNLKRAESESKSGDLFSFQ